MSSCRSCGVFKAIKDEWRRFESSEPGSRFIEYHHRVKEASTASRVARIALGLVLFGAGIVMLVVPGPGILFMVFGLACFGGESAWISKLLDRFELKARAGWRWCKATWQAMHAAGKVAVVLFALIVAAGAAYVMYRVLWA